MPDPSPVPVSTQVPWSRLERALREVTSWPVATPAAADAVAFAELDVEALVDRIGARLGGPPRRVAESAVIMGVASRLWSATVVPAARHGVSVDPARLRVSDVDGAVVLGVEAGPGTVAAGPDAMRGVVVTLLAPIVAALPLAPRLLWGNVAASLAAVPRVHDLPAARPYVEPMLAAAPLAGELHDVDGVTRRRTCCLFYLVDGAGVCGDCCFTEAPSRSGRARPATRSPAPSPSGA